MAGIKNMANPHNKSQICQTYVKNFILSRTQGTPQQIEVKHEKSIVAQLKAFCKPHLYKLQK